MLLTISSVLAVVSSDAHAMGANPTQFVVKVQCPPLKIYTQTQSKQIGEARKKLRASDPKSLLDVGWMADNTTVSTQ